MRWLILGLLNLFTLLRLLPGMPFRAFARQSKPIEFVKFTLTGDPPWRRLKKRKLFSPRPDAAQILSIYEFDQQLSRLAADPRVQGIILDLEHAAFSSSKRRALTDSIEKFRAAGKKVVAHAVTLGNIDYELVCAADTIAVSSAGRVDLIGFAAEATTIAGTLEKVGVRAEFLRRGEHKTAPELFTHKSISDVQRQTIESLLDERYGELLAVLQTRRNFTAEQAKALVDNGPYSAKRAHAERLVDLLISRADLSVWLKSGQVPDEPAAEDDPKAHVRLGTYATWARRRAIPVGALRPLRRKQTVALVPVVGMIVPGEGGGTPVGPEVAGSEGIVRALKEVAEDEATAAVLFISSPGGSAVASEIILEQVRRLAAKLPVIAFCDRVAASGGYMAALGAKEIWTAKGAVIGSIGVFAGKFDASGLMEKLGVHRTTIRRGDNAAIFSTSHGFSDKERATLDADIEETYQAFLDHVAKARKRTREEIHARAEGRVFSSDRALSEGLVDHVGDFEGACARALELAGAKPGPFNVKLYSPSPAKRFSVLSMLTSLQGTHLYALMWPLLTTDRGNTAFYRLEDDGFWRPLLTWARKTWDRA